jgi:hypothetical protein
VVGVTASCEVWLARDFLRRRAAPNAVWESPTVAVEPDGHRLVLPDPCVCNPADCPPHQTTPNARQEAA